MKFTCHPVGTYKNPIAWCIVGEGRFYKGSFVDTLKSRVQLEYPGAEFEDSFEVTWGKEQLLRQGQLKP